MSDTSGQTETSEIASRAADWVQRRNFWKWSDADQAELDAWLAQSMAHRVAYWRLNATVDRTERLTALRPAIPEQTPFWRRRGWTLTFRAVAALTVVAALGVAATEYVSKPVPQVFATTIGGREVIRLKDGSQIELNTDTVLKIAAGTAARDVTLEKGEAYFQIKHDALHPFSVTVGNHRVVDLGTRFLIRKDDGALEVSLLEGRARFDAPGAQTHTSAIDMRPGDVVLAKNGAVTLTHRPEHAIADQLGWRTGVIVFDSTQLANAASEFNRYGGKKLVIADPLAARLKIEGTFQLNNVEAFADAVQVAFGLHIETRADEIRISH
jgi:transmembrane sensor